jgi:hypothetical protein
MSLLPNARLLEINLDTDAATRPLTELEKFFSHQMAYAAWELERVRANAHHIDAEPRLLAAQNRANRNWNRARKQLTKLQTARVNHATRLSANRMEVAEATPLADPARVPMPSLASKRVIDHTLDLRGTGNLPPEAAAVIKEQEAR